MKLCLPILLLLLLLTNNDLVLAGSNEILVVVDSQSDVAQLTSQDVINIFLGRFRRLPNGKPAIPIDHSYHQQLMADFYRLLVNKDLAEIKSYWSRLVFSGETSPPQQSESFADLINKLKNIPGAIGYILPEQYSDQFKIVLTLDP